MKLGLKRRMALAFAVMLALMLSLTAVGWWQTRGLGAQLERVVAVHNERAELAHQLEAAQLDWMGQLRALIVYTDAEDLKAQELLLLKARERYLAAEKALAGALQRSPDAQLQARFDRILAQRRNVETPMGMMVRTALSGAGAEAALVVLGPTERGEQDWRREIAGIVTAATAANEAEHRAARSRQAWTEAVFLLLSAAAALLGVLMALGLTRSITRPVDQAVRVAERIAEGDLGVAVDMRHSHEMGRLFAAIATMQQRLRETVGGLRSTAEALDGASAGIGTASKDLLERTESAAAQLQQTTASVRELTEAVLHWVGTARQASSIADAARGEAHRGDQAMVHIGERMQGIAAASTRIQDIVGVIDGIAFQTNVLALNASVEAARAGAQGRGFGVVATEVRVLAQRAGEAAKQIRVLSSDVVRSVDEAARSVQDAGGTVTRLLDSADEVARVVEDIARSADVQRGTLLETGDAIGRLDDATQRNAVLAEELAASTVSMEQHAGRLSDTLRSFRLDADASAPGPGDVQDSGWTALPAPTA